MIDIKNKLHDRNSLELLLECHSGFTLNQMHIQVDDYVYDQNIYAFGWNENNRLIGIIIVEFISENNYEIREICVEKKYRKYGIGKKMITEIVKHLGIKNLKAETNNNSVDFFRNCGFDTEDICLEIHNIRWYKCILEV